MVVGEAPTNRLREPQPVDLKRKVARGVEGGAQPGDADIVADSRDGLRELGREEGTSAGGLGRANLVPRLPIGGAQFGGGEHGQLGVVAHSAVHSGRFSGQVQGKRAKKLAGRGSRHQPARAEVEVRGDTA